MILKRNNKKEQKLRGFINTNKYAFTVIKMYHLYRLD